MALVKTIVRGMLVIITAMLAGGTAQAAMIVVDDFDGLVLGPIVNQDDWRAGDALSVVTIDPDDADNQILSVLTSSTYLSHAAVIPAGEVRMLFLRFRYEEQLSASFGMSDQSYPTQFGDFEVELSLTSTNDELRINDDGTYLTLLSLAPEHWYNCWLSIDNDNDVTSMWIHDRPNEPATMGDQVMIDGRTSFPFRGGASGDLKNFYIKTGGGDGVAGPLLVDHIYLQDTDGLDLSYPDGAVTGVETPPARMPLLGAAPNPFNPRTTITFTLAETQPVQLAVYGLNGRLIRTLGDGTWAAGSHDVVWDGSDQAGAPMPSGVYLVRLVGGREVQAMKLVLAK